MTARRPVHKRVDVGAADGYRTTRPLLAADVEKLCVRELAAAGLDWSAHVEQTKRRAEKLWMRGIVQEGRGRKLDKLSLLAYELDRKLWFSERDAQGRQMRPGGPSPQELACIWLLLVGVGHVTAAKITTGYTAEQVVEDATEAAKKAIARHGQKTPWFPAIKYRVVGGKLTMEPAPDAEFVKEASKADGALYRYGMKRARLKRRGLSRR